MILESEVCNKELYVIILSHENNLATNTKGIAATLATPTTP
jgi:hypothetical protein